VVLAAADGNEEAGTVAITKPKLTIPNPMHDCLPWMFQKKSDTRLVQILTKDLKDTALFKLSNSAEAVAAAAPKRKGRQGTQKKATPKSVTSAPCLESISVPTVSGGTIERSAQITNDMISSQEYTLSDVASSDRNSEWLFKIRIKIILALLTGERLVPKPKFLLRDVIEQTMLTKIRNYVKGRAWMKEAMLASHLCARRKVDPDLPDQLENGEGDDEGDDDENVAEAFAAAVAGETDRYCKRSTYKFQSLIRHNSLARFQN